MGRHRSTLRDLGWAANNSPNPWKQGSAKRVVRALDYSNVELDEPPIKSAPAPAPPAQPSRFEDRLQQLQQDGSKKLDRIREQYEAEDAENKRKLDRLNGRIAELGEGKRHMWSILGQQQKGKPDAKVQPVAAEKAAEASGADGNGALRERQEAVWKAEAALANKETLLNETAAKRELQLRERLEKLQQAEEVLAAKGATHEQQVVATNAQMTQDASAASKLLATREVALAAREAKVAEDQSALRVVRATLADKEAALALKADAVAAKEAGLLDQQRKFAAAASAAAVAVGGPQAKAAAPPVAAAKPRADEPAQHPATAAEAPLKPKVVEPEPKSKGLDPDSKDLPCDRTADWVRSENLQASLLQQQAGADQVFEPMQGNETCKLSDIFSNPRARQRGRGSGEWTPLSVEKAKLAAAQPTASATVGKLQLVGIEGEYIGEVVPMALAMGADGCIVLGRSSSCDITLARDDQISRRHLQISGRDGCIFVRDLGSTYGTWLNKTKLEGEQQLCAGDVVALGASSFKLHLL